jgi:histidine triad (HIT) family protein
MTDDCVFCKIVKGEVKVDLIRDYKNFIIINDSKPISDGHCLIISKKHFRNLLDTPSSLGVELLNVIKEQSLRLVEEKKADGIKIIQNNEEAAGQTVFHTHIHIIPEKKGVKRKKGV